MIHLLFPFFSIPLHPLGLLIDAALTLYAVSLAVLLVVACQGTILLVLDARSTRCGRPPTAVPDGVPTVTVQLPVYNEVHVVGRLIRAVCAIDHPRDRLEIQVLDDSTDETTGMIAELVGEFQASGFDIRHVRRSARTGFKAGALQEGLRQARGEFIAIFDADFVPHPAFLRDTLPHFTDASVAMVQTRWEHLNEGYSPLTRVQAFAFDGHFAVEQRVRSAAGHFLTFNGTGGIWRRESIVDAGGWHDDTLTEDLDLSYRAQLRGWRLVFLNDTTSPSELPADFNALRMQQYRWTRGYIETARKILPAVWRSSLSLHQKLLSTMHLSASIAFPFMLLVAVLNAPIAVIKAAGGHNTFFLILSVFILGFASMFLVAVRSQRVLHADWPRRMAYFPAFLAGSMGLSLSNAKAVVDGLLGKKGTFVRTPKFALKDQGEGWAAKRYASNQAGNLVVAEILLALYCFFGAVFSLYQLEFLAVPFQLMFAAGFSIVAGLSMKHARSVRRSQQTHTP